jgi:ABC-2 type transport system permease protein
MSTPSHALSDSATMLRRNLRHMLRYPSMTLMLVGMPIIFLLLFVFVFGGTLGAGLGTSIGGTSIGGPVGGRAEYVNYVAPAIILMTVTAVVQGTSISVAMDMTEGIIDRFRTMAIARVSVLTGHVIGSLIQTLISLVIVIGVALLVGFRPSAGPGAWIAAAGFLAVVTFALVWLSVALGQVSKSVETASNLPMPLILLPFLGSGFVPTDSMPAGMRWFAEYQPFTPIIETLRGLLMGTPIGNNALIALGWCVVIALGGYLWSKKLFNRESAR